MTKEEFQNLKKMLFGRPDQYELAEALVMGLEGDDRKEVCWWLLRFRKNITRFLSNTKHRTFKLGCLYWRLIKSNEQTEERYPLINFSINMTKEEQDSLIGMLCSSGADYELALSLIKETLAYKGDPLKIYHAVSAAIIKIEMNLAGKREREVAEMWKRRRDLRSLAQHIISRFNIEPGIWRKTP